jgi:hypothetical protein
MERSEIRGGVIIASLCNADVFRHYGVPFFLKLLGQNLLQRLEADTHHAETSADRERVLGHFVPSYVR